MNLYAGKKFLEVCERDLDPFEKEECKIIISEYLNSNKEKKMNVKNANQLYYIIDFLIEYINNKEKIFKEKITESNLQSSRIQDSFKEPNDKSLFEEGKKINIDHIDENKLNTDFNNVSLSEQSTLNKNQSKINPR